MGRLDTSTCFLERGSPQALVNYQASAGSGMKTNPKMTMNVQLKRVQVDLKYIVLNTFNICLTFLMICLLRTISPCNLYANSSLCLCNLFHIFDHFCCYIFIFDFNYNFKSELIWQIVLSDIEMLNKCIIIKIKIRSFTLYV